MGTIGCVNYSTGRFKNSNIILSIFLKSAINHSPTRQIAFQINLHIYLDVEAVAGMLDQKANESGFILKKNIKWANV